MEDWIARNYPQVNASTKRIMFGPSGDGAIEVRIKERTRIRCALASQVGDILAADPATDSVRNDAEPRQSDDPPAVFPALGHELGVDKQDIDNALGPGFLRESRRGYIVRRGRSAASDRPAAGSRTSGCQPSE